MSIVVPEEFRDVLFKLWEELHDYRLVESSWEKCVEYRLKECASFGLARLLEVCRVVVALSGGYGDLVGAVSRLREFVREVLGRDIGEPGRVGEVAVRECARALFKGEVPRDSFRALRLACVFYALDSCKHLEKPVEASPKG